MELDNFYLSGCVSFAHPIGGLFEKMPSVHYSKSVNKCVYGGRVVLVITKQNETLQKELDLVGCQQS